MVLLNSRGIRMGSTGEVLLRGRQKHFFEMAEVGLS